MIKLILFSFCIALIQSCSYKVFYPYPLNQDIGMPAVSNYFDTTVISGGVKIKALFVKPKSGKPKASIFLLHGNRQTRFFWADMEKVFVDSGYQLFIMDYRGYGKSEGEPNHKNVLTDAQNLFNEFIIRSDVKNTRKVIMGISLGGNLAIKLASLQNGKFDALVTEAAFTTHFKEAWFLAPLPLKPLTFFISSPYKAQKLIGSIKVPKLIIHSTDDKTVPFKMGRQIFNRASEPKVFWQISGQHTYGAKLFPKQYVEKLDQILGIKR